MRSVDALPCTICSRPLRRFADQRGCPLELMATCFCTRRKTHLVPTRERRDRLLAQDHPHEKVAPGRIRQRVEDPIRLRVCHSIYNHMVVDCWTLAPGSPVLVEKRRGSRGSCRVASESALASGGAWRFTLRWIAG